MIERIATLSFRVFEGDVEPDPNRSWLWPLEALRIGLDEALHINWVNGQWEVTNPRDDPDRHWVGHAENQNLAILDYLRARLGIPKPGEERPNG